MDATWHARLRGSATWKRASLRGKDVTRGALFIFTIYIYLIKYIGLPIIRRQSINPS